MRYEETPANGRNDSWKTSLSSKCPVVSDSIASKMVYFLDSDFSATLLSTRKRLGYTQKEMAGRIGVQRSVYRDWEKGRKAPTRGSFDKIKGVMKELK